MAARILLSILAAAMALGGGSALVSLGVGTGPASSEPSIAPPIVSPGRGAPAIVSPGGAPAAISFPVSGTGSFDVIAGQGPVLGRAGTLMRFQIAIENGIGNLDRDEMVHFVEMTYGDDRGWTSGGRWRFQRVGPGQAHDFVLYLATPATRDVLCADGLDRYTSCRNGDLVVVNVARWALGVPNYGASLETYRQYVLNHETGHRLGFGHELCTGAGQGAPVMQQQTLGLHGCVANAWPYLDGRQYQGPPGQYEDPIPPVP